MPAPSQYAPCFRREGCVCVVGALGFADASGANFEFRNLRYRIHRADRAVVGSAFDGPMVRHENVIGPDGLDHVGMYGNGATPSLYPNEVTIGYAEPIRESW